MTLAEQSLETPQRRCIVTGETGGKDGLVRFVVGPDARIVPDLAGRLPGRGLWVQCRRDVVRQAVRLRSFERAARARVAVDDDLDQRVEDLLRRRLVDLIAMARRAGLAVQGFARVRSLLESGGAAVLITAGDGAEDGRRKLRALAPQVPTIGLLSTAELGQAFGRESTVHAALRPGGLARALCNENARLSAYRSGDTRETMV